MAETTIFSCPKCEELMDLLNEGKNNKKDLCKIKLFNFKLFNFI